MKNVPVAILLFLIFVCVEIPYSSTLIPLSREDDPRPLCPCGIISRNLETRVIGGHDAMHGQFPFAAALLPNNFMIQNSRSQLKSQVKPYCGGTLITERHVVTAAHCIRDRTSDDILLDIGDFNIATNERGKIPQYRDALRLKQHHAYVKKTFNNDIGIIEFLKPVNFSSQLKTAWLPPPNLRLKAGTSVTVYGWGRLSHHGYNPDVLQTLELPVVKRKTCQRVYLTKITSSMICAGGYYHKDACAGDSGSGLVTRMDDDYVMVGLVSFGKRCGMKYVPGVYTNVSKFVDWIYNETKSSSCQPCIASPENVN